MRAREFWKAVTLDRGELLDRVLALLREHDIKFCVVGGQAVNAYVEPVVSLDLDLAVATDQLPLAESAFRGPFRLERFEHSVNISAPDSDLRVQLQTDPRYSEFVGRATEHEILGVRLPVARVDDVLQGKIWAVTDPTRRASKRQKDLADIARLLEAYPALRDRVPAAVLSRLV